MRSAPILAAFTMAGFLGMAAWAPLSAEAPPAAAPEAEAEAPSLLEDGARMMLRGLMQEMAPALDQMGDALAEIGPMMKDLEPQLREMVRLMGDLKNYEAPVKLPNGDIIIRRKMPELPESLRPREPAPNGEIDL